ncbi:MAG: GGDEF domain-containing protein [Burkholderiales bacterium]
MELDPRSLVVASVLNAVLMGSVSIGFAALSGSSRIIGSWGRAMLLLAFGLLGLGMRDYVPLWLSAVVGNTLIVAAIALAMRALRVFVGSAPRDVMTWVLLAALFMLLIVFTEVQPSNVGRTIAISSALGIVALRAARLLHRKAPAACKLSSRVTEYVFWGVAVITALRIVGMLLFPPPSTLAAGPFNSAVFLFYSGFIIVSTLSVMWMEIESLQAELVRAARYDALTGLYNRGTFLEEFEREVSRCARGAPAFSLALFDLDRFKQLNDEFGHPFGDRVLKAFADVLRAAIRKHDTVGRYGGEEFALLMPNTGKDTAMRVAERLRRDLEARGVVVDGKHIEVTASGGISTYGVDGDDWDTLLTAADTALYEAKGAGRNRILMANKPHPA